MTNAEKILKRFSKDKILKIFEKLHFDPNFEDLKFSKKPLPKISGQVVGFNFFEKSAQSKASYRLACGSKYRDNEYTVIVDLLDFRAIYKI